MAWPTDDIVTSNLDSSADSAAAARANLYTALLRIKDIIAGRNTANGVAPLDASSKVPVANIPTLSYLPSTGGTVSGATTFSSTVAITGAATMSSTLQVASNITVTSGAITASANYVKGAKNSQTSYSTAGVQSQSTTGNAGIGLHCSGSSAAYIEHTRGGSGVAVKDSVGALANIAGAALTGASLTVSGSIVANNATESDITLGTSGAYFFGTATALGLYDPSYGQYWYCTGGFTYLPRVYNNTTATTANMVVAADGNLYRSTSLRKFKTEIAPIAEQRAFDLIDAAQFRSLLPSDGDRRFYGFIADDVAAAVPEAATWDADGNPEGINDRALVALLWREVQSLRARVAALEARG